MHQVSTAAVDLRGIKRCLQLGALLAAACCVVAAHGQTIQPPKFTLVDAGVALGTVASRTLDFTSTEECLRRPWCHEQELPDGLVHNKAAFAGFEVGTAALSLWSQYYVTRHGHRRLARIIGTANVSLAFGVSGHNYAIAKGKP